MKTVNLTQHGQQWLDWRKEGIGSSDAAEIMGVTHWAKKDSKFENAAMSRGHRLEPEARKLYEEITGRKMTPICIQSEDHPWLRASLDGYNSTDKVILEIKCPKNDYNHIKVLQTHRIPPYYIPQVMHQLLVCDEAKEVHFWTYTDSIEIMPHLRYFLVAVHRDSPGVKEYLQELFEVEQKNMKARMKKKEQAIKKAVK